MRTNFSLSTLAIAGVTIGLLTAFAPSASAADVDQYDRVRYVFCSDAQTGNDLDYYDALGKREQVNVALRQDVGGNRWCGSIDYTETAEYGSYVWSAITNENANYVYCAIWVSGQKQNESEDYGHGYSATMC